MQKIHDKFFIFRFDFVIDSIPFLTVLMFHASAITLISEASDGNNAAFANVANNGRLRAVPVYGIIVVNR